MLEALKYFKAHPKEKSEGLIALHHEQVAKAVEYFHSMQQRELQTQENGQDDPASKGSQISTALNLLTNFMREIDDPDLLIQLRQLKTLAERGVITYIAKRLQRIQKDLRRTSGKARLTHDEALEEVIKMARKYSPYYTAEESLLKMHESEAEIILSESFQKA
ncbi:hypothetical protein [uncultured Parasutterella sp.]|uniref:hypothetical protein n=1 Tax=uncultured Parasutterella sp. TaxID=1263098 RepID=UPI002595BB38|nr:hypothetical protein [uncultured Parasutterella sp.]